MDLNLAIRDDFVNIVDGQETARVQLMRTGAYLDGTNFKRIVDKYEREPFHVSALGLYVDQTVTWTVPYSFTSVDDVQLGDLVIDSDGREHIIVGVEHGRMTGNWKFKSIALRVVFPDLALFLKRDTTVQLGGFHSNAAFVTHKADVPCRVVLASQVDPNPMGNKLMPVYKIFIRTNYTGLLPLPDGSIVEVLGERYDVVAVRYIERLASFSEIELVKSRVGTVVS